MYTPRYSQVPRPARAREKLREPRSTGMHASTCALLSVVSLRGAGEQEDQELEKQRLVAVE